MIIGHKYKITVNGYEIYPDVFTGTYKGINIYSYPDCYDLPRAFGQYTLYSQRLEFILDDGDTLLLDFTEIDQIEDVTNRYLCHCVPVNYDLVGSIEDRVKFALFGKRYTVELNESLNMENPVMNPVTVTGTISKHALYMLKNSFYGSSWTSSLYDSSADNVNELYREEYVKRRMELMLSANTNAMITL